MKKTVVSHAALGCGELHAISRNANSVQPVRYLVIQISDPTKPQTVPE